MKEFGKKKCTVYIKADEHANLDSLPFRYGFTFQKNTKLEIFACENWEKDSKEENVSKVDAKFLNPDGIECKGHFVLLDNKAQHPPVMTVINKDVPSEHYLSDKLRVLRKQNVLTTSDLIILHDYYVSGEASTVVGLLASVKKAFGDKGISTNELEKISDQTDKKIDAAKLELSEQMESLSASLEETIKRLMPAVLSEISHPSTTAENSALEAQSSAEKKPVSQPEEKVGVQSNSDEKITKIYGPPGTGKTTTLINLVKRFVAEGVAPQEIGYFAFTNFATRVAKERIQQTFPELNLENDFPGFRTIHSLAYRSLQNAEILTEEQAKEFDPSFTFKHEMMEVDDEASVLVRAKHVVVDAAGVARDNLISFEEYLSDAPISTTMRLNKWLGYGYNTGKRPVYESDIPKLKKYIEKYEAFKADKNVIDYTSILENAASNPDWLPNYKIVFVDEAQDLSKLQWSVVNNLITKSQAAFIAGDDDQAICEVFGASPKSFVNYLADKEQVLSESFRVPKQVHASILGSSLIEKMNTKFQRKEKAWEPNQSVDGAVLQISRADMAKLVESHKYKDWLIMGATDKTLRSVSEYFFKQQVPHTLKNRVIVERHDNLLPSVHLATIWGAKGGEADVCVLLRDYFSDEQAYAEDPRLIYVAQTRTKHIFFEVFERGPRQGASDALHQIDESILGLPDINRPRTSRNVDDNSSALEPNFIPAATKLNSGPQDKNSKLISALLNQINERANQREEYLHTKSKLLGVEKFRLGQKPAVKLIFEDGSHRKKNFGPVDKTYEVALKLVGQHLITDVANPTRNNEFEWFKNIYLADD